MSRRPHSTSLLLLGGALLATLVPGVYALQSVVRHLGWRQAVLATDWRVRVNDQNPALYAAVLTPSPTPPEREGIIRLQGTERLWQPTFPWRETPFQADVVLDVQASALTGPLPLRLSTDDTTPSPQGAGSLAVTYGERYLASPDAAYTPATCTGTLDVVRVTLRKAGIVVDWSDVKTFEGRVDLQCVGTRSHTPGTVRWSVEGTVRTEWSPTARRR